MKQSGKKIDDLNTTVIKKSMKDNLPIYIILIIILIIIVICYILYKKVNALNEQNDAFAKKEKEYLNFIKEQTEQNSNIKNKFNMLIEHSNHISSVINENFSKVKDTVNNNNTNNTNNNTKTNNNNTNNNTNNTNNNTEIFKPKMKDQMGDIHEISKEKSITQPEQREMMPTSIFQSSVPLEKEANSLPPPSVTINKKSEIMNSKYGKKATTAQDENISF